MAKIDLELPADLIRMMSQLEQDTYQMMGEMTTAGAQLAKSYVTANMRQSFDDTEGLEACLKTSKVYRTPSDGGINTKVMIDGYFTNRWGQKVAAPLVANAREYGTARGEQKKPFFRKSFNKRAIEAAMQKVQDKYIKDDRR